MHEVKSYAKNNPLYLASFANKDSLHFFIEIRMPDLVQLFSKRVHARNKYLQEGYNVNE